MPETSITRDSVSSKIALQRKQSTVQALGIAENFIDESWMLNDNSLENIDTQQNSEIMSKRSQQ